MLSANLWLEKYFNCFGPFSVGTADETPFVISELKVFLHHFVGCIRLKIFISNT